MDRKEIGGWQGLLKLIAARIGQEVVDDRLDRATETASGHLTRNPKHVAASFALKWFNEKVLAGAISPNGKIALVVARDDFQCGLVTWSREEGLCEDVQGKPWWFDQEYTLAIFFPHGSEEPAVVARTHDESSDKDVWRITWGNWFQNLPEMRKEDMCVRAWEEGETRHVAFLDDGHVRHYAHSIESPAHTVMVQPDIHGGTRWIGIVGGFIATITSKDDRETVRLGHQSATLKPGFKTISESVCVSNGRLAFAAEGPHGTQVFRVIDGNTVRESYPQGERYFFDNGQIIYAMDHSDTHQTRRRVQVLSVGESARNNDFRSVGSAYTHRMPKFTEVNRAFFLGSSVVLASVGLLPQASERKPLHYVCNDGHHWASGEDRDRDVDRFHHGIGRHRVNEYGEQYVSWESPMTTAKQGGRVDLPLYDTPFDRLTPVEDARGKAIMSWSFVDGTLHVLRYDLPTEQTITSA